MSTMRSPLVVLLLNALVLVAGVLANDGAVNTSQAVTPDDLSMTSIQSKAATKLMESTKSEERQNPPPVLDGVVATWFAKLKNKVVAQKRLDQEQNAVGIFLRLNLHDATIDGLLDNPKFHILVAKVDVLNKKNPDNKVSIVDLLTKRYGDAAVAKELQVALSVEDQKEMALRLISEQKLNWLKAKKSAEEVYTLLGLHEMKGELFGTLLFKSWYYYGYWLGKDRFSKMAWVLMTHYKEEDLTRMFLKVPVNDPELLSINTRLQSAVEALLLGMVDGAYNFFKVVHFDTRVDDLLTHPSLLKLIFHVKSTNKIHPGWGSTILIRTLVEAHGDEPLSRVLEAAKKVPHTAKVAAFLQPALLKKWLYDGKTSLEVWRKLKLKEATLETNPNAAVWYRYNGMFTDWLNSF